MTFVLKDKVALVTGSAHRVGKAIALEMARQGVHQVIHFHSSVEQAAQTVIEVQAMGVEAFSVRADLSVPTELDALFDAVAEHYGRLDILINSASIFEPGDLLEMDLDTWQRSMAANLTAPFLCLQRAARMMRSAGSGGTIVNISDLSGLRGSANYPQHSVSKAGLLMLTRVAARKLAPDIRVNAVIPGLVLRPPDMSENEWERLVRKTPLQRAGSAEDVARAVIYLASEDYLTGHFLTIDGGESLL